MSGARSMLYVGGSLDMQCMTGSSITTVSVPEDQGREVASHVGIVKQGSLPCFAL